MVYVIHMTEWRIRLRAKILNGVRSVAHVSFNRIWVSQVERVMRGPDSQCLFGSISRRAHAGVLTQSQSQFTAAPAWILARSRFRPVIQTDSDWMSTQFIICSRLIESHFI